MKYVVALIFCVFMGITGISLGFGAGWPQINQIAAPMVCPGGTLTAKQSHFRAAPGKVYTTADYTCEDSSGNQTPVSKFVLAGYAGTMYGLVLFGLTAMLMMIGGRGKRAAQG